MDKRITEKKVAEKQKNNEEIKRYMELTLHQREEVMRFERFKYLKEEARKRNKKTISYTLKTAPE